MKVMEKLKQSWRKTPRKVRRPLVLTIGGLFVIAAGLTGWIPGPGGMPLFLIGVAILASEFTWAERFRDYVLHLVLGFFRYLREHLVLAVLFWAAVATWIAFTIWFLFLR